MRVLQFTIISMIVFACGSDIAWGKTIIMPESRTITINQVIDNDTMVEPMNKLTQLLNTKKSIYIILNSQGGGVVTGMQFIQLMNRAKARGITIHCVVDNQAMSMAFGILSQCSKRYAFRSSLLLWHRVRQMAAFMEITRHKGKVWEYQIGILDDYLDYLIFKTLDISLQDYTFSSDNNIVHTGYSLQEISPNFMTIIDDFKIKGDGK
jgi:hypothetical protein